jgi:hypothetical protein
MRKYVLSCIAAVMLVGCGTAPKYSKDVIPKNSAYNELVVILDKVVNEGGKTSTFWCTSNILSETDLFAVSKYQLLGKPPASVLEDSKYTDSLGGYNSDYTVRVWSSTKGGSPIVINWKFSLLYGDRYYSKNKGNPEWCIRSITNLNVSDVERLNESINGILKSLGTLKR